MILPHPIFIWKSSLNFQDLKTFKCICRSLGHNLPCSVPNPETQTENFSGNCCCSLRPLEPVRFKITSLPDVSEYHHERMWPAVRNTTKNNCAHILVSMCVLCGAMRNSSKDHKHINVHEQAPELKKYEPWNTHMLAQQLKKASY